MGVKLLDLDALLDAAADRNPAEPETAIADILIGTNEVKIRFTELDSYVWSGCTSAFLPRDGVPLDQMMGYDIDRAAEKAAPLSGVLVDGDETAELTPAQWKRIFANPRSRDVIKNVVYAVNEHEYIARWDNAKKASEGASKRKPPSRAKSESATAV